MPSLLILGSLGVSLVLVMSAAQLVQHLTRNAGWVDVFWTLGTGIAGATGALLAWRHGGGLASLRAPLVAACALAWSARLALHIARRTIRSTEDVRYARFRREWGSRFEIRLFALLMIQAAVAWALAVSVTIAASNPTGFPAASDVVGGALLIAAIGGEALADRQMRRFRAANHDRRSVCDTGLWGISRHPNYVFEWFGWVSYAIIAIGFPSPWWPGAIALIGPALMYWLLVHVSGVPPLEREMLENRGDVFADYQARVPAFLPFGPRLRHGALPSTRTAR